jgi:hypothetical protein
VQAYREKKLRRRNKPTVHYLSKKVAADNRYRINGRFISAKERAKLTAVLKEEEAFNENHNLRIELVSKRLNIIKT